MEDTSNTERNTKKKKSSSKSSNVVSECDGLPPPQSLPLPSVKSYTIPRRLTTNKGMIGRIVGINITRKKNWRYKKK